MTRSLARSTRRCSLPTQQTKFVTCHRLFVRLLYFLFRFGGTFGCFIFCCAQDQIWDCGPSGRAAKDVAKKRKKKRKKGFVMLRGSNKETPRWISTTLESDGRMDGRTGGVEWR